MCDTGFAGEDCSVPANSPPDVVGVVDALCDVSQGPCLYFFVQGFGFLDQPSLTCHYTLAENNVNYTYTLLAYLLLYNVLVQAIEDHFWKTVKYL